MSGLTPETATALVRRLAQKHGEADPHRLAEKILDEIPPTVYRQLLEATLPTFVRGVIGRVDAPLPPLPTGQGRGRHKQTRLRAYAWLSASGLGVDGWKRHEEFTLADCEFAADARRKKAKENESKADWYDRLATTLRNSKVDTLGALSDETLAAVAP